jgi:probable F420-dependent oxidoreductase
MKLGLYLRNMGPQSTRDSVVACARAAEAAGIDELWVADHIAIPPDDAEGSGGRYLDPLATLATLAGATSRIGLGTGVLVLPYRPPLATAKWVATIQELSGNRLLLGVGAGWMQAEFRAVGVDPRRRGRITDAALEFLNRCFAAERRVERPALSSCAPAAAADLRRRRAPHALRRAVQFGDGWMPMGADADTLRPAIVALRAAAAQAGKPPPEVVALTRLPLDDRARTRAELERYAAVGVTRVGHAWRYADAAEFTAAAEALAAARL